MVRDGFTDSSAKGVVLVLCQGTVRGLCLNQAMLTVVMVAGNQLLALTAFLFDQVTKFVVLKVPVSLKCETVSGDLSAVVCIGIGFTQGL
ncbi:hypothetical protein D1Z90_20420 [Motilimonas pumila]|uniref:Uncharacterized protein n=1 Tax=Motilimonas pumila TaxID=2303987 RepID=A0A418Y952_9GAMM|nr:hypothetical protein D1Z90_20420 [Motilimonas pumila]